MVPDSFIETLDQVVVHTQEVLDALGSKTFPKKDRNELIKATKEMLLTLSKTAKLVAELSTEDLIELDKSVVRHKESNGEDLRFLEYLFKLEDPR